MRLQSKPRSPGMMSSITRLLVLVSMAPMVSSAIGVRVNKSADEGYFDHIAARVTESMSGIDVLRVHDCVEQNVENPRPCFNRFTVSQSVFWSKYFGVGHLDEKNI